MTVEVVDKSHGTDDCVGGRHCDSDWEYEYDYCYESDCLDLTCCCDVCDHHLLASCGDGGVGLSSCCKCVPKAIIARFTPDTETSHCRVQTVFVEMEEGTHAGSVKYESGLPGLGRTIITLGCRENIIGYEYPEDGRTEWRIQTDEDQYDEFQFDEAFPIDHMRGASCRDLPDGFPSFEVTAKAGTACNTACTGTLSFEVYQPYKVPFRKRQDIDVEAVPLDEPCGAGGYEYEYDRDCMETCSIICITRLLAGQDEEERQRHEFRWDDYSQSWTGGRTVDEYCGEEEIELVSDEYGNCAFHIVRWDESTGDFEDDIIPMPEGECLKFRVEAEDLDGNHITISCSNCGCWRYVCEECRCVCETLCMIGWDDGELVGPASLTWDDEISAWVGDAEYGEYEYTAEEMVNLTTEEGADCNDKKCKLVVAGFEDEEIILNTEADPDLPCSPNLSFTVTKETEEGFSVRTFWCSRGAACGGEGSCATCDDVPAIVYADITGEEFNNSFGCNYAFPDDCIEPFTVDMHIIRDFSPNATADTRWVGFAEFVCQGCSPGEGFIGDVPMRISLELSCDGTFDVVLTDLRDGETCVNQFDVASPCTDCEYPYEEMVSLTCQEEIECCLTAGINIALSE